MGLPAWQRDVLAAGELFRVGGAVRDRLRNPGAEPPDVDFLVRAVEPRRLEEILSRRGRLALVGRSFGVYRFTPDEGGATVDIVYPRLERSTGVGHRDFDVQWDWRLPVEADLQRRDFTINAMAEDVATGRRIDPAGGEADLRAGVLRMIFEAAFEEDPLRILRGIRFAAQLDLSVEADTRARMAASVALLNTLSPERVQDEFTKILTRCSRPSLAFLLARDLGALDRVLPELDRCAGVEQNEYHPDDVFVHSLKTCDCAPKESLRVRWAALMHDTGKVDARDVVTDARGRRVVFYGHEKISASLTRGALQRLRYGNALVDACTHLVAHHMFNYEPQWKDATVRRFMRAVGDDRLEDLFALREADCRSRDLTAELENLDELRARVEKERQARGALSVKDLPVDGRDVMRELGIEGGPRVGRTLNDLLDRVLDDPAMNDRDRLLAVIREMRAGGGDGGK